VSEEIKYDLFLSHYQKTGGLLAMVLKLFLTQKDSNLRIFLDVDDLENIHDLKANVQQTNCFALLLTEGVFERRFVQEEIRTALALNKKIILIWDKERCAFPDSSTIPSDINSVLLTRAVIWQAEKSFRKVVIDEIYSKIRASVGQVKEEKERGWESFGKIFICSGFGRTGCGESGSEGAKWRNCGVVGRAVAKSS
jgi:hypothetical protein